MEYTKWYKSKFNYCWCIKSWITTSSCFCVVNWLLYCPNFFTFAWRALNQRFHAWLTSMYIKSKTKWMCLVEVKLNKHKTCMNQHGISKFAHSLQPIFLSVYWQLLINGNLLTQTMTILFLGCDVSYVNSALCKSNSTALTERTKLFTIWVATG